jgi:hypothetical protein
MKPDHTEPSLAADDPRLSEWLDGRLPAAEAAEIARAVAASPQLSRLVADLRGIKKSLASLPASPPPAAFVGAVMAALDATAIGGADDAAVEAEWRKIERQRLEEEIAEARDDAAEPVDEPMRHRWPWLALAGALAAGVLVAVVINRAPLPGDREVALAQAPQAELQAVNRAEKADGFKMEGDPAEFTDRALAKAKPGDAAAIASDGEEPALRSARRREATDGLAEKRTGKPTGQREPLIENQKQRLRDPGSGELAKQPAQDVLADEHGGGGTGSAGGGGGGGGHTVDQSNGAAQGLAGPIAAPPAAAAAPASSEPIAPVKGLETRARFGSSADAAGESPVRVVMYRVRTTADRARLDNLVAASNNRADVRKAMPGEAASDGETARRAIEKLPKLAAAEQVASPESAANLPGGKAGRVRERIEVFGSAAEIAALVSTLEAGAEAKATARSAAESEAEPRQGADRGKGENSVAAIRGAAERGLGGPSDGRGSPEADLARPADKARPEVVRLIIEVIDESGATAAEGGP